MSKITACACPECDSTTLEYHTTAASEIHGNCWQSGWIQCARCGFEGPGVQMTDAFGPRHILSVGFYRAVDEWVLDAALHGRSKLTVVDVISK